MRGFVGGLAAVFGMSAAKLITLSLYSVISRLVVFMIILFAYLFLEQQINKTVILLAALSFIGVILEIKPSILGLGVSEDIQNAIFEGTSSEYLGILLAFGFVVLASTTRILMTKVKSSMTEAQNNLYIHLGMIVFTSAMNMGNPFRFKSAEIINYIVVSVAGYGLQHFLMVAVRLEPNSGTIAIIQTSTIVFGFTFDYFIFDRVIIFWNVFGAIIIFGSTILALTCAKSNPQK